ncbi:Uncharacterised protein r2_g2896 [Pycnogonum litorale]
MTLIYDNISRKLSGLKIVITMENYGHLLFLAIFLLLTTVTSAADKKPVDKVKLDDVKNVTGNESYSMARSYFEDVENEIDSCRGEMILFVAGVALVSGLVGALLSPYLTSLFAGSNIGTIAVPTIGTIPVGTTSVLPSAGRRKRSVNIYKHQVWNNVPEVLASIYEAVKEYENNNQSKL